MKTSLFLLTVVASLTLTSWSNKRVTTLCVRVPILLTLNVLNSSTYSESCTLTCQTNTVTTPCELDLTMIDVIYGVDSKADFLNYLTNNFSNSSDRVYEVERIAVSWQ